MYIVEANLKEEMTERQYHLLIEDIPLTGLYELSSACNRILASFVSEESAESFAKSLRVKGQLAVVYEEN